MPIKLEIDKAMLKWQAKHNQRMTYAELAEKVGISLATLNRMKNGDMTNPDLRKINLLCKALECELPELMVRYATAVFSESAIQPDAMEAAAQERKEFFEKKLAAEKETPRVDTGMLRRRAQR